MYCNGGKPLWTPTVTKTKPLFNHLMACIIRRWSLSRQIKSADKFCEICDAFILDKEHNIDIYAHISFHSLHFNIRDKIQRSGVFQEVFIHVYITLDTWTTRSMETVLLATQSKVLRNSDVHVLRLYPRTSSSFRNTQFLVTRTIMSRQTQLQRTKQKCECVCFRTKHFSDLVSVILYNLSRRWTHSFAIHWFICFTKQCPYVGSVSLNFAVSVYVNTIWRFISATKARQNI